MGVINKGKIAAIDTPERLKRTFEVTQSVEISFDKPIDFSLIEKSNLVNRMKKLGDKWKLYSDNPDKLIKYLAKFAQEQGLIIVSMEICRPSLEDAFVKLTESKIHAN